MSKQAETTENKQAVADEPVQVAEPHSSRGLPAATLKAIEDRIVLDMHTYDKTDVKRSSCKLGTGYQLRQNADGIIAIVAHTSNGKKGQTGAGVAEFLMKSKDVATHFVISQADAEGKITIYQVLPPYLLAWACGLSAARGFHDWNQISISVEIVCAGDEGESVSEDQKAAFAWLCAYLRRHYPHIYMLERHADIAQPPGRKHDPNQWLDPNDPKADPATAWKRWVDKNW